MAQGPTGWQPGQGAPPAPPPHPYAPAPKSGAPVGLIVLLCAIVAVPVLLLILGVVAAIVFPAFANAREKARQTSCLSNQRQLATGLLSYAQDNNERFPPRTSWCECVSPHIMNHTILSCPSLGGTRSNYWLNDPVPGRALAEFKKPAEAILQFEARDSWDRTGTETDMEKPHNGSGNVAFVDGHAKWLSPTSGVTVEWKPTWSPLPPAAHAPVMTPERKRPAESAPTDESEPHPSGWRDD